MAKAKKKRMKSKFDESFSKKEIELIDELIENYLVSRKLDRIDRDIKAGKRKLLNSKQALGKYAKYLK